MEALKEQYTLSELAVKYELHPSQITNWKNHLLSGAEGLFKDSNDKLNSASSDDHLQDELYKQIGQLRVENEWLKKNLNKSLARVVRLGLIDRGMEVLSIVNQCEQLGLARSSYFTINQPGRVERTCY